MKKQWALSLLAACITLPLLAQPATTTPPSAAAPAAKAKAPDVVFVPTPQDAVDQMLELAEVKKSDLVYDLGCGDGRIVVTAAKKYGARAVGYDIDEARVKDSVANVKSNGVENLVTIKQADIFTLDLSEADVVTLYLLPSLNVRLIPQLEKLKPGARVISYSFDMKGIKPAQVVTRGDTKIYKWVTPLQHEEASAAQGTSSAKASGER